MKKPRVKIDFIQLSIPAKIIFYRNIIAKLTANLFFTTPYISLADAILAVNNLEASALAAADGGHTLKSIMRDSEEVADNTFRVLAHYVSQLADGDVTKMASSGFNQTQDSPAQPKEILTANNGTHPGDVRLVTKAIKKTGVYIWQSSKGPIPTDEQGWKDEGMSTQAHYEISGFTPGELVNFRVCAVTADGITEFCVPVSKIII